MKPRLRLVGEDGNAFAILGRARRVALQAGWTDEDWQEFHREATSADYNHLLATVMEHFDCDPESCREYFDCEGQPHQLEEGDDA